MIPTANNLVKSWRNYVTFSTFSRGHAS